MKIIKCNKRFYLRTYENISSGRFTKSGKEIMKTLNTTKRNSTSKYAEDFFETQDKTIDVLCKEYLTYNFGVVYSNGESYNEN